jgi:hypothetical protein
MMETDVSNLLLLLPPQPLLTGLIGTLPLSLEIKASSIWVPMLLLLLLISWKEFILFSIMVFVSQLSIIEFAGGLH